MSDLSCSIGRHILVGENYSFQSKNCSKRCILGVEAGGDAGSFALRLKLLVHPKVATLSAFPLEGKHQPFARHQVSGLPSNVLLLFRGLNSCLLKRDLRPIQPDLIECISNLRLGDTQPRTLTNHWVLTALQFQSVGKMNEILVRVMREALGNIPSILTYRVILRVSSVLSLLYGVYITVCETHCTGARSMTHKKTTL